MEFEVEHRYQNARVRILVANIFSQRHLQGYTGYSKIVTIMSDILRGYTKLTAKIYSENDSENAKYHVDLEKGTNHRL